MISVVAFWQREIFDFKVVKYLDESKSLKTQSELCPISLDNALIKLELFC